MRVVVEKANFMIFPHNILANLSSLRENSPKMTEIRKAAVSGTFYPGDKISLLEEISAYLREEDPPSDDIQNPKILIIPHAGYAYSGPVAAAGYRILENKTFQNIIIVGASHAHHFSGAAISSADFETPLGLARTNLSLAEKISAENPSKIQISSEVHQDDHNLEVQIPFLQTVLGEGNFRIVTILLGDTNLSDENDLVYTLDKNLGPEDLLLISSDLSHYPDFDTACQCDRTTIDGILSLDSDDFLEKIRENKKTFPQVDTFACGERAISVALKFAKKRKLTGSKLLKYANSGHTGADLGRVVGYASIAFFEEGEKEKFSTKENVETQSLASSRNAKRRNILPNEEEEDMDEENSLSKESKKEALEIARNTLENCLQGQEIKNHEPKSNILKKERSVFVTLHQEGDLRGCIGSFYPEGKTLAENIQNMAIQAALHDPRFPPVQYEDLESIEIEISVLSPLEKIDDPNIIEVGRHGVMVKKGLQGGVYLPQVATEQGWDRTEMLNHLCQYKAGIEANSWQDGSAEIFIFEAEVFGE